MTSQIRGLNMAIRNLNDGVNMMQTAEGAMIEQSKMLQRMRELAVQANNGTYSSTQRGYLDLEFQALATQIGKIASETMWNDQTLLATTTAFTFQAGQSSGQTIIVSVSAMGLTGIGLQTATTAASIGAASAASTAISTIGVALEKINLQPQLLVQASTK